MTAPGSGLVERLRCALDLHDASVAKCPVQKGYYDACPRCKATSSQMCGLIAAADYRFVEDARAALAKVTHNV